MESLSDMHRGVKKRKHKTQPCISSKQGSIQIIGIHFSKSCIQSGKVERHK